MVFLRGSSTSSVTARLRAWSSGSRHTRSVSEIASGGKRQSDALRKSSSQCGKQLSISRRHIGSLTMGRGGYSRGDGTAAAIAAGGDARAGNSVTGRRPRPPPLVSRLYFARRPPTRVPNCSLAALLVVGPGRTPPEPAHGKRRAPSASTPAWTPALRPRRRRRSRSRRAAPRRDKDGPTARKGARALASANRAAA
jgi:hypothetical protein